MKTILTSAIAMLIATNSIAATAADIRAIPEADRGLAIAKEADARDTGFMDSSVSMEMVLRNKAGSESRRKLRNKTFEMVDPSVGDKSMIIFDHPRDIDGTAFLTFSKITDPDDQWLYLPALKRVKRINSKNKSGPFMGSEFAYEDLSSQEVAKYTYTYLREEACPTEATLSCFVIERVPTYKHSGYTKQVGWIDVEEFRPQQIDFYDRRGAHLKTLTHSGYQQYLGKFWRPDVMRVVNHQNGKSTDLIYKDYAFRTGVKESDMSKAKLKNAR